MAAAFAKRSRHRLGGGHRVWFAWLWVGLVGGGLGPALGADQDQPALHARIDALIAARMTAAAAPIADDAEFLRRAHLDFAGRIPTSAEVRRFVADGAPDKRTTEIDRLLSAPDYADRMTDQFHTLLMEQRGDHPEWERFLRDGFAENRPWDELVRDILLPPRDDERRRGAAFFYTRRLEKVGENPTDYPGLTRDVGRLFLGVDLQCAECHDHLFIDDYKQVEFQGLLSVYKQVSIRRESFPAVNEATMTARAEFASVFVGDSQQTGPRIPFGQEFEIPEPPSVDPAAKKKRPDPNDPPTFSALALIAGELPSQDSRLFSRNIANRLWFLMLGRGLVEPLDQLHSANPPTHPELLDLLASELVAHDFDLRWMLREIALSETYQRSSRWVGDCPLPAPESYALANQRWLTPRQLLHSSWQATGPWEPASSSDEQPNERFQLLDAKFKQAFGLEAKEPALGYAPSVKLALFQLNDADWQSLLQPQPGTLVDRVVAMDDRQAADELYLSLFSRFPTDAEREATTGYLQMHASERSAALQRIAWAMLSSMEFCVNH